MLVFELQNSTAKNSLPFRLLATTGPQKRPAEKMSAAKNQ